MKPETIVLTFSNLTNSQTQSQVFKTHQKLHNNHDYLKKYQIVFKILL